MKKIVSLAMCLCLIISTFAVSAVSVGAETTGDFNYNILDNGTVSISNYNGKASELVIPGEIDGYTVTDIDDCAFKNCISLKSVTIPDSVVSIGEEAFASCTSLTNIIIGNGVTTINYWAFYNTGYYNNNANWENDVLYIDNCLIEARGVSGDYKIKDGTRVIADYAFWLCGVTSVTIPDSVISVGEHSFYGCKSLKSIIIPDSVKSIGNTAFYSCPSLTSITVDKNNSEYCDVNGVLFNKEKTVLMQYPIDSKSTSYTIPNSVTSINNSAFYNCKSLESITIGNGVKSIGSMAFKNCEKIKSVIIPNSVTSIGEEAFYSCVSLENLKIPSSVTSIGENAFNNCELLKGVKIPDGVRNIGDEAFSWCESLKSITISDSVTSIGYRAFSDCKKIKSVIIPNSVTSIGEEAFGYYKDFSSDEENWYIKVKGFTVKGHKGSNAEKYAKANGMTFVAAHNYKGKVTKPATYFANGKKVYKCSCGKGEKTVTLKKLQLKTPKVSIKAGKKKFTVKYTKVKDATGFEVKYKVGKKWTTKKFKTAKSVSKTIRKLKKGSYKVQIRAFIQSGRKYAYSKAVTKTVNVK